MNKKLFTLFLVIAASAIFAVSCNNKTTDPVKDSNTGTTTESKPTGGDTSTPSTPTTPTPEVKNITDDQIETALKTFGELKINDGADKANAANGKYSEGTFTITVDAAAANAKKATTKSSVEAKLATVKSALDKIGVTCSTSTVTVKDNTADGTFDLDVKVKENYKLPASIKSDKITVKITVTGKTWEN
ncbi:unnamed protein product [Brachyspira suanatina]|uniref:Lipoprotein n=1 Tax=Brachyspira suanatina TaxID=381802 RepID=A0A0G4K802_9SPIR|nr:hypothetical protein [Brachyspira suanatina]CRF34007.1 unnamed protein product [Brachyspira suanatina]